MENLAGREDCDQIIRSELNEAGVYVLQLPNPMRSEVAASVIGLLPGFKFHREWYYWEVKGQVPLDVARRLYHDPNGREDVRVAGHAGCPPPEEWAEHYDSEGKRLVPLDQEESLIKYEGSTDPAIRDIAEAIRRSNRFVEDPEKEATRSVVTSYHIDTQAALNFFVSTLRENKVVPPIQGQHNPKSQS